MGLEILFAGPEDIEKISKALKLPLRRKILSLLKKKSMNITELCETLNIPQSTCTLNIQILEKADLINTKLIASTKHGREKLCSLKHEKIMLSILDSDGIVKKENKIIETEMPIGLFSDCSISSPCGIISEKGVIGYYDNPSSFLHPLRAQAGLLWFTYGYLEYKFPKNFNDARSVSSISFSLEICSEYPGYNNNWPSDITLWINNKEIGTWKSEGDMGGKRGLLTPLWWDSEDTQYGFLKSWIVNYKGSFMEDGCALSSTKISDLDIEKYDSIIVKIGVKENAINRGGINIFGSRFGNYNQDLKLKVTLN